MIEQQPRQAGWPSDASTLDDVTLSPDQLALVHQVHQRLIQDIDIAALEKQEPGRARATIEATVRALVGTMGNGLYGQAKEAVVKAVMDEAIALGPIQPLVDDESVSEVMINAADEVYFERDGVIFLSPFQFRDDAHIMRIVDRIIAPLGRRVDESSPYVDARLPDGSRVNAVIAPLALDGPVMSIRRFGANPLKLQDLLNYKAFTPEMVMLMEAAIKARLNIVISGGTGSGKTTLLNTLSSFIPNHERVITIEDAAELQLQQEHVVRLETRPPNLEGKGAVTQRDLVRNSLRMRPDRIIIGECRGAEALDMLQAMNTGHEGSMTTIHANTPRDGLARLETMIMMAGFDLPIKAMRQQIASAVDLIIQSNRLQGGPRKITSICEVMSMEQDTIIMQEIFVFKQVGVDQHGRAYGRFESTGVRPSFIHRFETAGIHLPANLFAQRVMLQD